MNRLPGSTSPYLLQHADNPVDWYPWGEEALSRARREDKPIFLSIGYAACHWCHVMAHESFEDPETARLMNEHFVNIKVDREERPDIDSVYMQAVVAMTGSGGWPMSIFLAPDLKPFYAGTYFPPTPRYNMPAFKDVLAGLHNAWLNERAEIDKVGRQIEHYLHDQSKRAGINKLSREHLEAISRAIQSAYDWGHGGWGDAPKFPQPMVLEFLMHHAVQTGDEDTIKLAGHCLDAMARGGMYDVVGGGFSRYSTDRFWRIPHFEKMLYDNALLVPAYLHAWQITGEPAFKRIVQEILDFVIRELTHPQGGFFSSLDADSEGVEGKYYLWSLDEIRAALGDDAEFFEAAYGITAEGNWEGKTVLQRTLDDPSLAARFNLEPLGVTKKLSSLHARLLSVRESRIRPGTDDKVLTSWNGLMLAAFAEAGRVLNNPAYVQTAVRNAEFLLPSPLTNGKLRRSWRNQATTQEVFLEDYAALILGLVELYQTDFNNRWFAAAAALADEMIEKFMDPHGGFFDTPGNAEPPLIHPKDIQDNALPSGNSLACEALLKLAAFTGKGIYRDLADTSLSQITDLVLKYPLGFARWLSACEYAFGEVKQVAVIGEAGNETFDRMMQIFREEYRPGWIIAASPTPDEGHSPALLSGRKMIDGKPTVHVCRNFVCELPTHDPNVFTEILKSKEARWKS